MGLPDPGGRVPLVGVVSRLAAQKGLDLVAGRVPAIRAEGGQLVVLGSGEEPLERLLGELAAAHPESVAVRIGFDDRLARRIYAGADLFLMPSRYEPCGLGQLIALRYGTVPIVRRTGGLADTVRAWDAATGEGTGFLFDELRPTPAARRSRARSPRTRTRRPGAASSRTPWRPTSPGTPRPRRTSPATGGPSSKARRHA